MGAVKLETRAPPANDPRVEPESDHAILAAAAAPSRPGPPEDRHSRPTPLRPPTSLSAAPPVSPQQPAEAALERDGDLRLGDTRPSLAITLRGASLPAFQLEGPPLRLPNAPLLPRLTGPGNELAEHLSLPPGIAVESSSDSALPRSVLEARIAFTRLSRELGLDYRLKRGIELRADVNGIEAMQAVLLESFHDRSICTKEDAHELRRHGALLSEILARRLDAEWVDISPNELGYWAMIIPPDTRVWPFGRIARLIEMGHKERDLVSYYLEISARAKSR